MERFIVRSIAKLICQARLSRVFVSVICRCFCFMIPLVDNRFSGPSSVVVVVGHGRGRFRQVPRRPWSSPVVVGRGRGRRQSISPGGPSPVDFLGDR